MRKHETSTGRISGALLCAALCLTLGACQPRTEQGAAAEATECASCHLPDYRATKKPMHVGVRPTQCGVCHTQDAWSPSVLNHPWPLTGAHAKAACEDCHAAEKGKAPVYEGTSKLCVDCHRDDYDGATYPGHSKFATTCADCHSTTAFRPARKPKLAQDVAPAREPAPRAAERLHPERRFPIKSGSHADIECRTCHSQGGAMSKADTDCVQCHARARFDRKHRNVGNYPQGDAPANFCVHCHTDGSVGSAR